TAAEAPADGAGDGAASRKGPDGDVPAVMPA
ncbi:redox-sensing transcriptional repressor Rex, partial [Streptomyces sp. NPDC001840]